MLFPSAGRRVELIELFRGACRRRQLTPLVIATDSLRWSAGMLKADRAHVAPPIHDPAYLDFIRDLVHTEHIGLLVPTIDTDLKPMALLRDELRRQGCVVVVSDLATVELTRDKLRFCAYLRERALPQPTLFSHSREVTFPAIVKPRTGSSSQHVHRVDDPTALAFYTSRIPDGIVQEFVEGEELTIDAFVAESRVRATVVRRRLRTRGGEVLIGVTEHDEVAEQLARDAVNQLPGAEGPLTVQVIRTADRRYFLTEVNARFGGGYPLSHLAGADFPGALIDLTVTGRCGDQWFHWREGVGFSRCDASIPFKFTA